MVSAAHCQFANHLDDARPHEVRGWSVREVFHYPQWPSRMLRIHERLSLHQTYRPRLGKAFRREYCLATDYIHDQ
jgi:hypothetical protein